MIADFSLKYFLLKQYTGFFHRIWYKNIVIKGKENIPKDKPYVFAPNHQNALMDAFAILMADKHRPVWLARADIFNKKTTAFLTFLKILPVYRVRDGIDSLGRNEEVFDIAIQVLKKKVPLALFPEGTHNNKRQLLPIKKAVQRIVFLAEEKNDFNLDIQIVPCGLCYSNYTNFRHDLIVNFGKPIPVKDYIDTYKRNTQHAFNDLRDIIAERIKEIMLHIPGKENYDTYELGREIYRTRMLERLSLKRNTFNKFRADQKTVTLLKKIEDEHPASMSNIEQESNRYNYLLKKNQLRSRVVEKGPFSFWNFLFSEIRGLILLPFFIYGFILNGLPFVLPNRFVRQKVKDPQFISSFNFFLFMFLFPLYYGILTLLYFLIFGQYTWLFFLSLPISGLLAFQYFILFKKTYSKYIYTIGCWRKKSDFIELRSIFKRLIKKLDAFDLDFQ
jgi:1-acyl-sn-glycerol-3-phosphate acyltransferase